PLPARPLQNTLHNALADREITPLVGTAQMWIVQPQRARAIDRHGRRKRTRARFQTVPGIIDPINAALLLRQQRTTTPPSGPRRERKTKNRRLLLQISKQPVHILDLILTLTIALINMPRRQKPLLHKTRQSLV